VEVLVLGIGGMMPMPGRWLTSAVVLFDGRATMFDCGEGTQVALKKSGFGVGRIERFVLSHLHGDHVLGVPGMLMLLTQAEIEGGVQIVGPPEVTGFVRGARDLLRFYLNYPLLYADLDPEGGVLPGEGFSIEYLPLKHSAHTFGFAFVEDERPGKFSIAKARELGVPEGPDFGRLQRGEAIIVGEREITPELVLGPPRRGRRFAYVTDTAPCKNAYRLLKDADFALIEAMFLNEEETDAAEKKHLTAKQAGRIVRESGCRRAVLGHVSPRYRRDDLHTLEEQARAECDCIEMARPLERYAVPLPD
jgi:ribonuclease Z